MKRILIVGSSRGIGHELAKHFSNLGHEIIGVSRTETPNCEWVKADVTTIEGIQYVAKKLGIKTN